MDDEIEPPRPSYRDRLIDYNINNINYYIENEDENDSENDDELRKIKIQSRKEYLDRIESKIKERKKQMEELSKIIKTITNKKLEIYIDELIKQYINLEIKTIVLNFDVYDEIIDHINQKYTLNNKDEILKLIECNDEARRLEYLEILKLSKEMYTKEQEYQKYKEKLILEIERRKKIFLEINNKMIIISKYDSKILKLKNIIYNKIQEYINCEKDYIDIEDNDVTNFINFLGSIRIKYDEKEIMSLFKNNK